MSKVIVIGAGFSGLSAACHLAKKGAEVHVVERHDQAGGRARTWEQDGFMFDMGPSWYWMPDLFERFFETFGYAVEDLYDLKRLDPSYRVVWPEGDHWDVPAGLDELHAFFEKHETGAGDSFDQFIEQTRYIYEQANGDYLFRPSLTFFEFVDPRLVGELFKLRMLKSMAAYARDFFDHPRLARLVEWPVLFLGASAKQTSAMYSLMSYADMALGTWYPMGGMHRIIEAMVQVATDLGVTFHMGQTVDSIAVDRGRATGVRTQTDVFRGDAVLAAADYHHVERDLLSPAYRQYSESYWESRTMSPSSLLYYLGVEGDLGDLEHHTLFFDEDLDRHMDEVYGTPRWPQKPLFYACAPSVTDPSVTPEGHSNLFLLIPLAPGLPDSDAAREKTFQQVMQRLEAHIDRPLRQRIVLKRSYAMRDFEDDYSAYKGNAYGMANTLRQTGPLKPKLKSEKLAGLYFAGQLTVPGPGMPPSLVSGELSAGVLMDELS